VRKQIDAKSACIRVGGIIHILVALLHLAFWWILGWKEQLPLLSDENSAVLQVLNIHVIYVALLFATVSMSYTAQLVSSTIGRFICGSIAGFWLLRGVNEFVFWGLKSAASWISLLICFVVAALYVVPLVLKNMKEQPRSKIT
jgi:hypothetical protein